MVPVLVVIHAAAIECSLHLIPRHFHAVRVIQIVSEFHAVNQLSVQRVFDRVAEEVPQCARSDLQHHDRHDDSQVGDEEALALEPGATAAAESDQDHEGTSSNGQIVS